MILMIVNENGIENGYVIDTDGEHKINREYLSEAIDYFEDNDLGVFYLEG